MESTTQSQDACDRVNLRAARSQGVREAAQIIQDILIDDGLDDSRQSVQALLRAQKAILAHAKIVER